MTNHDLYRELSDLLGEERAERVLRPSRAFVTPESPDASLEPLWRFVSVDIGREEGICGFLKSYRLEAQPIWRKVKRRKARVLKRQEPKDEILPGYILAKFATYEQRKIITDMAENNRGVYNILQSDGKDFSFDDNVLEQFTDYMNSAEFDESVLRKFKAGDKVRIEEGPFTGFPAKVDSETDLLLTVLVEILGGSTPITLDKGQVRKVA